MHHINICRMHHPQISFAHIFLKSKIQVRHIVLLNSKIQIRHMDTDGLVRACFIKCVLCIVSSPAT